jgi:glycosyltransferase involved in cell wall biosynthesis
VAPPASYDRQAWRAALGLAPGDALVAYFGLLSRSKGVDVLLDALDGLAVPAKLLLIGGEASAPQDRAYAAEVAGQIERLGLAGQVIRTGQVDAATVSAHLLAADCAALPFRDGASFRRGSLLAALAHGCAVVTTYPPQRRRGAEGRVEWSADASVERAAPQLINGEHALLVPPDDPVALAETLRRLAGDAALRARLGEGARRLAAHFGWEGIAQRHEQLYQALLLKRQHPL